MGPTKQSNRELNEDELETNREEEEEGEEEEHNNNDDDEEDENVYEEEDNEYIEGDQKQKQPEIERARLNALLERLSVGPVTLRVHDVIIRGSTRTKDSLIEAEVLGPLREASTMQELIQAAAVANARLRRLDVFDSVSITLDAGPRELPGTANVVVEVVELKNPLTGGIGIFSRADSRTWSLEGSLKLKNFFGYGDIWDASGAYHWGQTSEISVGLSLPRFKVIPTPLNARAYLQSQDWLKLSSYQERMLGLSFSLLSTKNHELSYVLAWRTLSDPIRMASKSIRRLLGHGLLSSAKYTYKLDTRDSHLRPTSGYAFLSTTQVSGLIPDSHSVQFIRQDFDLRGAIPLGVYNSAINFGVSAGLIFPWGRHFLSKPTPLPERFYIGGATSPVCTLGGPMALLGFKTRGFGPTDARRYTPSRTDTDESSGTSGRDALGGDLAVSAFADFSFDLPLKLFREAGIHGHTFVCAGNVAKLSENEFKNFSPQKFLQSIRSSVGVGMIVPTKLLRLEINYCYILRQFEHDKAKTGFQFSFSSPF